MCPTVAFLLEFRSQLACSPLPDVSAKMIDRVVLELWMLSVQSRRREMIGIAEPLVNRRLQKSKHSLVSRSNSA